MNKQDEFLKMIQETFRIEAKENIDLIATNLLELEKDHSLESKAKILETTFRAAHSLKGAARAVDNAPIEKLCQALENVFSGLKDGSLKQHSAMFDTFHEAVNLINEILELRVDTVNNELQKKINTIVGQLDNLTKEELAPGDTSNIDEAPIDIETKTVKEQYETELDNLVKEEIGTEQTIDVKEKVKVKKPSIDVTSTTITDKTIRISTSKLDSLLFQAEEMLSLRLKVQQRVEQIKNLQRMIVNRNRSLDQKLSSLLDLKYLLYDFEKDGNLTISDKTQLETISEIETDNSFFRMLDEYFDDMKKDTNLEFYEVSGKVEDLMYNIKNIISVPFNSITRLYPKVVRDLAKDQSKKINIEIKGDDLELDRRILEEIRDPLMHILRNSVDHGIETPSVRESKKKPSEGLIRLTIERMEDNTIEITFMDDGAGLDFTAIRKKYIKDSNITNEQKDPITDDDLLRYIFKSGVSTAGMITDISGRGLGMAIVKEKIKRLGGSINVSSEKDKGTQLKIKIPLSLVNFTGILVEIGDSKFVIPTSKVQTILRVNKKDVKTIKNKDSIAYKGKVYKLCYLSNLLQINVIDRESDTISVIIFDMNEQNIGFVVDSIIGEEVYQTKKFNKHLEHIKNISGATILGSGGVVPILNVYDLIQFSQDEVSVKKAPKKVKNEIKKKILIVEDSITSRMLLKNILESTGYDVQTAVDGMEGYSKLKEFNFDMILSDIDMPRMNGFEMTSKIRSESKYEELPIILVTSLSRREDKERGMEVGANAYIVKSSFDQNNLLETIKKLL